MPFATSTEAAHQRQNAHTFARRALSSQLPIPLAILSVLGEVPAHGVLNVIAHPNAVWSAACAGHQNVSITSTCMRVAVEDEGVGHLFGMMKLLAPLERASQTTLQRDIGNLPMPETRITLNTPGSANAIERRFVDGTELYVEELANAVKSASGEI